MKPAEVPFGDGKPNEVVKIEIVDEEMKTSQEVEGPKAPTNS